MLKQLLLLLVLITGATADLVAQNQPVSPPDAERPTRERDPEARRAQRLERLTEGLKLTLEQATEVEAIMARTHEQMTALRGEELDREERRARSRTILETEDDNIEALLDDKQLKRYQNMKKAAKERSQERRQGRRRAGGPNR